MKEAFSDFEIRWSYNSFISFDQLALCIMRFEFCFFEIIGDLFINELLRLDLSMRLSLGIIF